MGSFLYRIGAGAFRHKWIVLIVWVVLLGGLATTMSLYMKPTSGSISIPGTQAQKALDRFNELFPSTGGQSGRVVLEAPDGKKISDYTSSINTFVSSAKKTNEVTGVVSPFDNKGSISSDGTIAYITVQLKAKEGTVSNDTIDDIDKQVSTLRESGLTAETGGDLVKKVPGEILGIGEVGGVVLALIVLVITLGSLVAAGLPIIIALVTVGLSMTGLFSLSQFVDINSTTPALAVMLGLAVGIDYSLFITNRYRVFVHEGYGLQEAVGRAVATAGNAVLFAASTVVIALASLSVVQIPFMTTMGLSAAATVAIAAIVAITLIPAFLGMVGFKVFGRKDRKHVKELQATHTIHEEAIKTTGIWYRIAEGLLRYRVIVLIFSLIVLIVLALPVTKLELGLPTDETAAQNSSARKAYDLMSKGFGAGFNGPLLVVVENLPAVNDADRTAVRQQITKQYMASMNPQALAMATPAQQQAAQAQLEAQVNTYAPYYQLNLVAENIAKQDDVKQAAPILTTDNGTKGVIQVTPKTGPSDPATKNLVMDLRQDSTQSKLTSDKNVTFGITGSTAVQIDVNDKLAAALPIYLSVVIGLSLILLMVAFRSILIPIKATLGFLLSVFVMFGALVAVFQWGWLGIAAAPGPIVSFIPIIGIGILFGLAMDYEFFLVSGMQEAHHHTKDPRLAVLRGYALGSRVVVAAGLIMVSVFAGFIGNSDTTIQSLGFALAFGIFIDAFIVRLTIVPIVMSLLGRAAWWLPKWLNKIIPHISIEGNER